MSPDLQKDQESHSQSNLQKFLDFQSAIFLVILSYVRIKESA